MKLFTIPETLRTSALSVLMVMLCADAYSQCALTIGNLPDTISVCKNTTVQLSPTLIPIGNVNSFVNIDTVWSPAFNLSSTTALNPTATIGTASIKYTLSVTSITQTNNVFNGDFSMGNTGFTSAYKDTTGAGSLWPEGYYSVTTNPDLVHPNFVSMGDHTTGTGNMLVINGASAPVNVWCETITVTPNTQYDFSAWGATVSTAGNPAQVQFEINGTLVGTTLTLPTATGQWTEFHTVWYSGSNTSITICVHDQQTAASGNDFALDDISFREICTATDSVYIHVTNIEPAITTQIKLGCSQDTVNVFAGNNGGDVASQYKWDFGDGTYGTQANMQHIYTQQGQYTIKLVGSKNGCGDSTTKKIDTRHPLSVGFSVDKDTICATQSIKFTNSDVVTGPGNYYWNFGDSTTDNNQNPTHQFNKPGTYTVMHVITDVIPCSDTITKTVLVQPLPTIKLTISDSLLCEGIATEFASTYTPGTTYVNWDFGDGDQIVGKGPLQHAYYLPGNYTVTVTANYPQCPAVNATKNVTVFDLPHVNVGPDTSMCPYSDPIVLSNSYNNNEGVKYLWNTGDTVNNTLATQPGTYWLQISNASGCFAADSVEVFKSCYIDIPNVFSPNGDGVNDYFFPRQLLSKQVTKFHMEVFNRWGEIIFQTDNISGRGWDGNFNNKPQPEGVYIYSIDAQINGYPEEQLKGNVTLLR